MEKVVIATLCFAAGAGLGFAVGYSINRKEAEAREQEAIEAFKKYSQTSEPEKTQGEEMEERFPNMTPAKFAKPTGEKGINYSAYNAAVQEVKESIAPPEGDDEDTYEDESDLQAEDLVDKGDYEETYEEMLERESNEYIEHAEHYKKEHAGKIELMTQDEWDSDYREADYERQDLYFFTEDDTLTDEDGAVLAEEEFIGPKVRQVGWMRSPDDVIYIRNHPKEMEFRVFKERCSVSDWF